MVKLLGWNIWGLSRCSRLCGGWIAALSSTVHGFPWGSFPSWGCKANLPSPSPQAFLISRPPSWAWMWVLITQTHLNVKTGLFLPSVIRVGCNVSIIPNNLSYGNHFLPLGLSVVHPCDAWGVCSEEEEGDDEAVSLHLLPHTLALKYWATHWASRFLRRAVLQSAACSSFGWLVIS